MADVVTVEVKGFDQVLRELAALGVNVAKAAGAALRAEAEVIMTESKRRCPVDTGALVGSGHVTGPDRDLSVKLMYGGPSAPYALAVHEMPPETNWRKRNATNKFLEHPVNETVPQLPAQLAARMRADAGL